MKRFPIFRKGRHTASSGATLDFSEDALRQAVAAYDPALHEAPIVVGHPKDNLPAYGWIGSLSFDEDTGEIVADPKQVDADFAEMVQAGRFKKRSASWYLPDAPGNPKPGSLYLRHVGFLGAQPPAVKGLRDVSFSAADDGVVEFSDYDRYAWGTLASLMRGLREWLIGDKGLEVADKVLPNFYLSELDDAAKKAREQQSDPDQPAGAMPAFSEEDPMKLEELQARVRQLEAENATLKANQKPADFAERESSLAAREAAVAAAEAKATRAAIEARVEAAVKDGRLLPAQKKLAVDFAMGLTDGEATIDFGEGDKAKKVSQREAYLLQIETGAKVVDYGEHSRETGDEGGDRPSIAEAQAALSAQVFGGSQPAKK
jgi:phage I-like protein